MWTYVARRLLMMIPTLIGITIVSFLVMQLAPGDPLLSQLGAAGASGESSQTREAYLIQKRELKLDKPILLNFNYFKGYGERVRLSGHFLGISGEDLGRELPSLDLSSEEGRFMQSLGIEKFEERLNTASEHPRLAQAVQAFCQVSFENMGAHGVPDAIRTLSSDAPLRAKIGVIRGLNHMVVDPYVYSYSTSPDAKQTEKIQATWRTYWDRVKDQFPPLPEDRAKTLRERILELSREKERAKLFAGLKGFKRPEMRVFAEALLGDATLEERAVCAQALVLYLGKPLKVDVALGAKEEEVRRVAENWTAHYEPRREEYDPGFFAKIAYIVADTQYAHMVWRLFTFQFGTSAVPPREPVGTRLWRGVSTSAPLMLMAQAVIYLVAVPLGILCAVRRGKWTDRLITLKLFMLYSIPAFVAGSLFLLFFCYGSFLRWFPMNGLHSEGAENLSWIPWLLDYLWHAALPVLCLSLFSLAGLAMYSRTSMVDVIGQDFVRTARAKGLDERSVIFKHALRNALIPIITLFASFLPAMLGGSVLIEVIFGIPGMGRLSFESIETKDYPTLMALIYLDAIIVMASILISDILYVIVDPRITFEKRQAV